MTAPALTVSPPEPAEKPRVLLARVLEGTRSGRLAWEPGFDGRTFSLDLPPGVLFVSQRHFEEEDRCGVEYQFDICDADGRPVESISDDFHADDREAGPLVDLYKLARGSARDATALIDQMLSGLAA